jgi:glyoxylate carboligase
MLSGGDMLIRALKDEGVEFVFGYPGGAALHIYDAIFRQSDVKHILVRHEQAATHAADGYARSTGKVGTVLVTWYCYGVYGLHSDGSYIRSSAKSFDWRRCLSGNRYGRYFAPDSEAQLHD